MTTSITGGVLRRLLNLSPRSLQKRTVQDFFFLSLSYLVNLQKLTLPAHSLSHRSSADASLLKLHFFGVLNPSVASSEAQQDTVDWAVLHPYRAAVRLVIFPKEKKKRNKKRRFPAKDCEKQQGNTKGSGKSGTCDPERTDTTVQADSKCRSPGDARVDAGAMSRRKQVNPQHLSLTHRETIQGEVKIFTRLSLPLS